MAANPGFIYDTNWLFVFPGGMDIGVFNPGNGNTPPNGVHWTGDVAGRTSLKTFLGTLTGTPSPLPSDDINPTSTSTGTLGRLTAVLQAEHRVQRGGSDRNADPGLGLVGLHQPVRP